MSSTAHAGVGVYNLWRYCRASGLARRRPRFEANYFHTRGVYVELPAHQLSGVDRSGRVPHGSE